jgi:hypothetical protein
MSEIVNIRRRARNLDDSPQFDSYSKVIIHIGEDSQITVGTDTGRTLEIDNPFGTRQMAEDILAKLQGYQYQPYEADGALLDPAAEIGDAVTVGNVYGGLYRRNTSFGRMMASDIAAPQDEEINHEFAFQSPTERKFSRELGDVRADLRVQSDEISAKVSATSIGQSFGWELLSDHWSVLANGQEIFRVDENGGTFTGKVVAASGRIGGFTISASAIYNNISEFNGTQSSGVYIGTNGIQLGQGFKVDASGHMTCQNATVQGTIRAGDIQYGGNNGYFNGSGISGGTVGTGQLSGYVVGGVGGGYSYNNATKYGTTQYPSNFTVGYLRITSGISFGGAVFTPQTKTIGGTTIHYLGW